MVGPRLGKYTKNGKPRAMPGHSAPLAILGVLVLWFGWFGFNPGSTMAASLSIAEIAVTTNLAAAAGALAAMFAAWKAFGMPDVGMAGNGALAGLVGITAGCAFVENWAAILIGAVAGVLVVAAVVTIERAKVDDPVGAVSVHAVGGVWGTLATGLFAAPRLVESTGVGKPGLFYGGGLAQLGVQAMGVLAVAAWVIGASFILFGILKLTVGLRVSAEEEIEGLDIGEHGMWGYPEAFLGSFAPATPQNLERVRAHMRQRSPGGPDASQQDTLVTSDTNR